MPAVISIRPWQWLLIALALAAMAFGVTAYWMRQADAARAELRQTLGRVRQSDRQALIREWGDKVSWTPDSAAPLTLAVMPRTRRLSFDAIYALYQGRQVVATLALTSIGGYFNDLALDQRNHPDTLLARGLTPDERHRLQALGGLLEERLRHLEPQSNQYGWTREVLRLARKLDQAQRMKALAQP